MSRPITDLRQRSKSSRRTNRKLAYEPLENRLLLSRSGLVAFDFSTPYDVTTDEGVRVTGDASFAAELTFLNSSDLSQISVGPNSISGSGNVGGTFNSLPISGVVDVNVENTDFNFVPEPSGLINMDATGSGSFSALVDVPPPNDDVNSTGVFEVRFDGQIDLVDEMANGNLLVSILTDDVPPSVNQDFTVPVSNLPINVTPNGFQLPDAAKASLSGEVWLDVDGDGVQDQGEPPKAGITVELRDANTDALAAMAVTNQSGAYAFIDMDANDYIVRFLGLPVGNKFTIPDATTDDLDSDVVSGSDTASMTVTLADHFTTIDAGIVAGSAHQNLLDRHDIDGDLDFDLVDVQVSISEIRERFPGGVLPETRDPSDPFVDSNGDRSFNVADVFDTIAAARNRLFGGSGGAQGEGEFVPASEDPRLSFAWWSRQQEDEEMLEALSRAR